MDTLGKNIQFYREKYNYSQKKLSKLSGISRSYISDLESGNSDNISIKLICKLCIVFKITPDQLIPQEMYVSK